MVILGISAFVHDSAACLIIDGKLVSNVEEERLDRIKHSSAFPANAIDFVLRQEGIRLADLEGTLAHAAEAVAASGCRKGGRQVICSG